VETVTKGMGNDPLTEVRFWAQVLTDSKRTVVCNPDLESRIKGWVEARLMGGLITVVPNPFCPADQVFVIDKHALAASIAETTGWKPDFDA
jgi:hypothetical protein